MSATVAILQRMLYTIYLPPRCVAALFLDLIMADVGLLNDQRILEWSGEGGDLGTATMSVVVVRLPTLPLFFLDTHSWSGPLFCARIVKIIIFAVKVLYFMIT